MSRNGQLNASKVFRYHSLQHFFLGNNLTQQPKRKKEKKKKSISVRILNQSKTENLLKVFKIVKKINVQNCLNMENKNFARASLLRLFLAAYQCLLYRCNITTDVDKA